MHGSGVEGERVADAGRETERGQRAWHALAAEETLAAVESRAEGLSAAAARERLAEQGPNRLAQQRTPGAGRILLRQFKSIVIIVLIVAGVIAAAMQQWPETVAIAAVIAINAVIGFVSEWRATQSMEALRRLSAQQTTVRRDGREERVRASQLVVGDVVVLRAEALVPADLRVLEVEGLQANEAALTGESAPIAKQAEPVAEETVLSERASLLFKGTTVVDGAGVGVVVATGMETEVGRIAALAASAEAAATPLQQKLDALGRRMAVLVLVTAVVIAGVGVAAGRAWLLMVETSLALGVAAIPEGLPIVATIALAWGMWLMARRNALVNRLPAVETLGATRVIFSDKTGTLTENEMVVARVVTPAGEARLAEGALEEAGQETLAGRALGIGVLCNGATLGSEEEDENGATRGDPLEVALLRAGARSGMGRETLLAEAEEVRRVPFDRETMMMATFHRDGGDGLRVAVKGAPERVVQACTRIAAAGGEPVALDETEREAWRERAGALARDGLRVLAVAEKRVDDEKATAYKDLCLVGLAALHDPPRAGVREAIDACQAAGIRVVMVTGDKPETAEAIAEQVGIVGGPDDEAAQVLHGADLKPPAELSAGDEERVHRSNIFARVTPEQKLNLVEIYQEQGDVIAMTGDGVNDAPALKKADIGVAMGQRGTEAAKQVADMVLRDDALGTVVAAVEQGRVIFGNIRSSVIFMLCTNGAEVLAVAIAALVGIPLPLRPLQILYLNVLTDVLPALALAVGRGDPDVMAKPPRRPDESILTRWHWGAIGGWSVLIAGCVLAALLAGTRGLGVADEAAITLSFLTLALAKLWFVFNLRSPRSSVVRNAVAGNPWMWGALGVCVLLLVAAVYLPGLSAVLETVPPSGAGWGIVLGLSAVPVVVGQVILLVRGRWAAWE